MGGSASESLRSWFGGRIFLSPLRGFGALSLSFSHGLRRGLHSTAALRLALNGFLLRLRHHGPCQYKRESSCARRTAGAAVPTQNLFLPRSFRGIPGLRILPVSCWCWSGYGCS